MVGAVASASNFHNNDGNFKIARLARLAETAPPPKIMAEDAKYGRSAITDEPFESLKARFLETLPGIDKFFEPKPAEPKPAEPKPEASEAENLEGLLARNAQWREHIFLYTVFIKWWGLKTLSSRR